VRIAALIPCHNEEVSVGTVVRDLSMAIPEADIYVYDNNSSDRTTAVAAAAGAFVRHESRQGKGYVIFRMFSEIDADVYLLIDGDATYDIGCARYDRAVDQRAAGHGHCRSDSRDTPGLPAWSSPRQLATDEDGDNGLRQSL